MRLKSLVTIGIGIGSLLLSSLVLAEKDAPQPKAPKANVKKDMPTGEGIFPRMEMGKMLGLSDEQKDKLKDLTLKQRKNMIQLQADAKVAQLDLMEALKSPNPNESDLKAKMNKVNETRSKILEARVDFAMGLKKILTPEQQKKMPGMGWGMFGMDMGQGKWLGKRGMKQSPGRRGFGKGPMPWMGMGSPPCME